MIRLFAALALTLAFATPAAAESFYQAKLERPAAPANIVSSEVVWSGHDNVLEAPVAGDVAKRVCAILAQQVGTITEFSAGGKALSADELGYCNKHARKMAVRNN